MLRLKAIVIGLSLVVFGHVGNPIHAEIVHPLQPTFSDSLTFNYLLASRGINQDLHSVIDDSISTGKESGDEKKADFKTSDHQNPRKVISFAAQSVSHDSPFPEGISNSLPASQDTESLSDNLRVESIPQPLGDGVGSGGPDLPNSTITAPFSEEEIVPSYIIHEPSGSQEARHTSEPEHPVEEAHSFSSSTDGSSSLEQPEEPDGISSIDYPQPPSSFPISRFDWVTNPADADANLAGLEPSSGILQENSSPSSGAEPADLNDVSSLLPARFSGVLDPSWEPSAASEHSSYGSIPLILNEAVERNIQYFRDGIHDRFQSYLDRFHHYRGLVEPIFKEYGLPPELMYLSLV
ncbi:MAG: hypothetical protein R3351_10030, partial [Nitrospirales bacterium]|nr:hypothetical protein [Nitrospirales bacterium]